MASDMRFNGEMTHLNSFDLHGYLQRLTLWFLDLGQGSQERR